MGYLRVREIDFLFLSPQTNLEQISYWVSVLWEAVLPGQKLADVVAGLFTGVTTALETVKSNLNAAWDGIVAAGNYIQENILLPIVESVKNFLTKLLLSIGYYLAQYFPVSVVGEKLLVGSIELGLKISSDLEINFIINGETFVRISQSYLIPIIEIETLGPDPNAYLMAVTDYLSTMAFASILAFQTMNTGLSELSDNLGIQTATMSIGITMTQLLVSVIDGANPDNRDFLRNNLYWIMVYHMAAFLGLWAIDSLLDVDLIDILVEIMLYIMGLVVGFLDDFELGSGLQIAMMYILGITGILGATGAYGASRSFATGGATLVKDVEGFISVYREIKLMAFTLALVHLVLAFVTMLKWVEFK